MSTSDWDASLAPADDLLTSEERSMLLDIDFFADDDLLKTIPSAATKGEFSKCFIQDDGSSSLYPPSPPEIKPSRAELANDLLQQLESQYKQENQFSGNWLEEKVDLPIFENISQVPERVELPQPAVPVYSAPQQTEELLREFETVCGAVALTHLTPPQSPPGPATQLLLSYAHAAHNAVVPQPLPLPQQDKWTVPQVNIPAPVQYDCDLIVEELVRNAANSLQSGGSTSASPRSSPPSSPRSSDEEWSAPSRSKPYSRTVDDRRSRKKEQNKNAATRYRQKKKAEVEVLLNEEQQLRQRHTELGGKCTDLQREIRYLKGLMRDLFKAKGLIK